MYSTQDLLVEMATALGSFECAEVNSNKMSLFEMPYLNMLRK